MNMLIKQKTLLVAGLAALLQFGSLHASVLTGIDPTIITIGSGPDLSYLVLDESTLYSTPLEFVYHYTYDSNNPLTGYGLLQEAAANSSLVVATTFFGGGLGNFIDSLTYNSGTTVGGTNAPDFSTGTYWSYYDAGGVEAGQATNPPSNNWQSANVGMDSRTIAPGSWDGWTFARYGTGAFDVPPSVAVAAVPEPATLPLLLLSLATLFLITRWKPFATPHRS